MITKAIISVVVLGYLLFRGLQAFADFRAGKVLARNWLIADRSAFFDSDTWAIGQVHRDQNPVAFWLWTIGQAAAILLIVGLIIFMWIKS
ncbi:MAG: hypothetical protein ACKOUT_04345 [Novosphingobium sp.]